MTVEVARYGDDRVFTVIREVQVEPGGPIVIRWPPTDEQGAIEGPVPPAPDGRVRSVMAVNAGGAFSGEIRRGRFRIDRVPVGTYRVQLLEEPWQLDPDGGTPVVVRAGETTTVSGVPILGKRR